MAIASTSRGLTLAFVIASGALVAACAGVLGFPDRVLEDTTDANIDEGGTSEASLDDGSTNPDTSVGIDAGPAKAALSTTALDFGFVACGAVAPPAKTVTITNSGGAPLDWTAALASTPDFTISGPSAGTIAPGATGSVAVASSPVDALSGAGDTSQAMLTITTSDPDHASTAVAIKRTSAGGTLSVTPLTAAFGEIPQNVAAENIPIVLKNTGNQTITVAVGAPTPAFGFTRTWTGAPTAVAIPAGGTMPGLLAGFTPTALGNFTATAPITVTGALCGTNPTAITFTGTGTSSPASVQPGALDFGLVDCGTTATAKTIRISNASATTPFNWSATVGTSYYTVTPASGTVGVSAFVDVTVTPSGIPQASSIAPNLYGDTLTVTTDAPGDTDLGTGLPNPHVVDLRMTAQGAILDQSTGAIDFKSVLVSAPATSTFTVTNSGNAPATVSYVTTPAEFSVSPQNQVVGAGANYTATARFAPTAQTMYSGTAQMSVSGTVLCAPLKPAILLSGQGALSAQVTPSSLDFGLVKCGATATAKTLTFVNTSGAPFTWTASVGTSNFTIKPTTGSLAKGASVIITVTPKAIPTASSTAADLYADTVTFQTTPAHESPYVASLHMTAQGAILSFNPTSLDFGNAKTNVGSKTKAYAVVNAGNVAAPITLKETGGQFSIDKTTATANAGSNAALNASFTPTVSGPASGTVGVTTTANLCAPIPAAMTLTGNGT
jgi:hypothetical protein